MSSGVYSIVYKDTQEIFIAQSGKISWKKPHHAISAWRYGRGKNESNEIYEKTLDKRGNRYLNRRVDFSDQDIFEVVELNSGVSNKSLHDILTDIINSDDPTSTARGYLQKIKT